MKTKALPLLDGCVGSVAEAQTLKASVTFTVEPSDGHHDVLTIQDAFQQAIDFFDLLTDEGESYVVWKLEMASTNSPFTCQGEPVDTRTWAGAFDAVSDRVEVVERNFKRIASGLDFDETFPKSKIEIARKILKRNTNGIGRSTAKFFDKADPVSIHRENAVHYFTQVLSPVESLHSYLFSRTSRQERGSIDGRIVEIGTDYDVPAIRLEEHNSGRRIWCRIGSKSAAELAEQIKAGDAWEHKRVRVRGVLNFDSLGKPMRIVDGSVSFLPDHDVDISTIQDRKFTEGYSVAEYLDRLQENEFGSS